MPKLFKIFLIIFVLIAFINLLFLDWQVIKNNDDRQEAGVGDGEIEQRDSELAFENKIATDSCGLICQKIIEEKIEEELAKIPSPAGQSSVSPSVSPKKIPSPLPTSFQSKIIYVPLTTEGTVSSISWTDIVPSEFYFNKEDYDGAKEVRFTAYLLSLNNDLIFARLYDVTNKRGVDFSDLQATSSNFTRVESSGMKIWQGNNKYTIQLRSVNGTQAQLKDAKLKIIY